MLDDMTMILDKAKREFPCLPQCMAAEITVENQILRKYSQAVQAWFKKQFGETTL